MKSPVITSIEDLQEVFMLDKKPFWRLYSGKSVNGRSGKKIGENQEETDLERSFELLAERLERYGNGTFSVAVQEKTSHNNNQGIVHTIQLANEHSVGTTAAPGLQQMLQFYEIMNQRTSINDDATIAGIEESITTKLEIERLKKELAEEKRRTQKDKIIDAVIGKLPDILERFLGPQAAVAGVSMLGTDVSDEEGSEGEEVTEENAGFSIDRTIIQVNELQNLLEIPVQVLLAKLIRFAKANPAQAQQLINSI